MSAGQHHDTRALRTSGPLSSPIRTARGEDVATIARIVQAAYRGTGGWTTEAHLVRGHRTDEAGIRSLLADPAVILLVADDAEAGVVGCCYTRREAGRAELGLFAVDPHAQSGGIGRRLLDAQIDRLTAAGVGILSIQVLQSRPELHAWYERRGFVRTGRELPFPGDPTRLEIAELRMVEMERRLGPR